VSAPSPTPLTVLPSGSLPMAAGVETERADAARNRRRLLEAAQRLVSEVGAEQVTMEAVAAAAEVGKGTVFRRFGDRVGLMVALLDHSERENQDAFMFGPPPLGPGAEPRARLIAFGEQRLRFNGEHKDVLLAAEDCGARRYEHPARAVLVLHVSGLLREAQVQGDVELLTETLLGSLDVALLQHLRETRGHGDERLMTWWTDLVDRVLPTA